jgi:hypothetical protein
LAKIVIKRDIIKQMKKIKLFFLHWLNLKLNEVKFLISRKRKKIRKKTSYKNIDRNVYIFSSKLLGLKI